MPLSKFLDPKNDVSFKRIFGTEKNKDILIHFINDILDLKGNNKIEDVTFLSPIQDPEIASKKQSIVDVLCKDANGVQLIVEMQVAPTKGFEKRAQYYASKAYSRQLNKGQELDGKYHNLKEVIFIAIADCILFPEKKSYKSDHVVLDKDTYEHDLKDFYFTFIELPKFKKDNIDQLSNMVEKWSFFFKHADETSEEDLQKLIGSDLVIQRAYDELNQFNWTEPELIAYEQEIKRMMDNVAALDYQIDKAKKEGREEGIEKGREEEKIEIAKAMLSKNKPLEEIAEFTGLSLDEIEQLRKY
jgi:predicted transposase/invertase (TIGR01784 family)